VLSGRALRPLPPCRLAARRLGADIRFTWLRQTRIDADSWELAEVPLAESSERYLFQILDGEAVKRSAVVADSDYLYAAADLLEDFASTPSSFAIRVCQLSSEYGAGAPAQAIVNV
jgi:hypothetical protein